MAKVALLMSKTATIPVLKWLCSDAIFNVFEYAMHNSEYATYDSVYAIEKFVRGTEKMVYATYKIVRGVYLKKHYSCLTLYNTLSYA